ncbi:MAG: GIY-YIG nuclease family protein, partial [Candidatus Berkelbacteria bacterium]|nr:GIY-YIG nuclease family protein [Candidatus Berkelbacteria bacterium]
MYYFYVLQSEVDGSLYYGSTRDLKKRLVYHNQNKVKSTKSKAPYTIKYYEAYSTLSLASKREYNV